MQRPLPAWLPFGDGFGDGEALPGYKFIKGGFKLATFLYYNGVHCTGADSMPPVGVPTLLCFNHSNGLVDAMMVIRSSPRMVRFMAKDTLWRAPGIGQLVQASGAVPVQRREEHGAEADTTSALSAVLAALGRGACVGIAPEGNSKMRTMLDLPLKKGVAHLAVEAALAALWEGGDKNAAKSGVHVVPCGLCYLQREKWRSEAMANYGKAIVVDAAFLQRFGLEGMSVPQAKRTEQYGRAVGEVMRRLAVGLEEVTLTVAASERPADGAEALEGNWSALARAVTAGRIRYPGGTNMPLQDWAGILRQLARQLASDDYKELGKAVSGYQHALNSAGLLDSQAALGPQKSGPGPLVGAALLRALLGIVLLALALPGLAAWSLVLLLCLVKEYRILRQGLLQREPKVEAGSDLPPPLRRRRNFDTIAEGKMLVGWLLSYLLRLNCCVAVYFCGHAMLTGIFVGWVLLPIFMWLTLRLLEESLALLRSARAHVLLLVVDRAALAALSHRRGELVKRLQRLPGAPKPVGTGAKDWSARAFFVPWRRWKADWHETLLFSEDLSFGAGTAAFAGAGAEAGPAAPLLPP